MHGHRSSSSAQLVTIVHTSAHVGSAPIVSSVAFGHVDAAAGAACERLGVGGAVAVVALAVAGGCACRFLPLLG
jgi:hypothetical protein